MKFIIQHEGRDFEGDFSQAIDISLPLKAGENTVNCFYAPYMQVKPVIAGNFVGDTRQGGSVNFVNVSFNPHGNGTHTECVGHISHERHYIHHCLQQFSHVAYLCSVFPRKMDNGDRIIDKMLLQAFLPQSLPPALIVRSLPNDERKMNAQYSGTNPPYFHHEAIVWLVEQGVQHLLTDLPSVDREEDGGKLLAHKAFWKYPVETRFQSTITELIYAPENVPDGFYLLQIQVAPFEVDASPSKPVLYGLSEKK